MKKQILCVIGESGTGKTHLANYLETNYGLPYLQSHTDRPKRTIDETGHTWHTKESFDKITPQDMIAFTVYGGFRYCAIDQDLKPQTVYVIDEPGLKMLIEKYSNKYDIKTLRLYRPNMGNINQDRLGRNLDTYQQEEKEFDYIIHNNGSLSAFEICIDNIMLYYLKQ